MVGGGGELVVRYGASMVGRVKAIAWLLLGRKVLLLYCFYYITHVEMSLKPVKLPIACLLTFAGTSKSRVAHEKVLMENHLRSRPTYLSSKVHLQWQGFSRI